MLQMHQGRVSNRLDNHEVICLGPPLKTAIVQGKAGKLGPSKTDHGLY